MDCSKFKLNILKMVTLSEIPEIDAIFFWRMSSFSEKIGVAGLHLKITPKLLEIKK
jgi:hypothetical protein